MIGQEEDAEDERYERCKLPHIRKLMQDRPCKEQSYQGDYAGERTRFRHGYSVDSFYPKYFLESEEKDAVYEQQWQRGPHIADRTAEAKKVQKRKKGRRGKSAAQEQDALARRELTGLLLEIISYWCEKSRAENECVADVHSLKIPSEDYESAEDHEGRARYMRR